MSNISIAKRILEICDKFEQKDISLEKFQTSMYEHGSALEGLGNEWNDLLNNLEAKCESIVYMEDPKNHYTCGLDILKTLRKYLKQKINNI